MQNDIATLVKNKSVDNIICGNISNISIMLQKNPPVQEKKGYFCIFIMNIRAIFRFADKNIMISLIREYEVMRHQHTLQRGQVEFILL